MSNWVQVSFLPSLSDENLLLRVSSLVQEERRITLELLHHLKELESRKLYAELGYDSLFTFLVKAHHYSESSAMRRIDAMRALRELPELEEKIESGKLNLTTLSQVQSFLKAEKRNGESYSQEEKAQLFEEVEGLSKRETEKHLAKLSPESVFQEKTKTVSETHTQITFQADDELMERISRIKELTSHVNPNPSYLELFKKMAQLTLEKIDPEKKLERKEKRRKNREEKRKEKQGERLEEEKNENESNLESSAAKDLRASTSLSPVKVLSRHIPEATRAFVWKRDRGQCQYKSPNTGQTCYSRHLIQIEHKRPFALGGTHAATNLELLCHAHNQLRAIQKYGHRKIAVYLQR